MKNGTNDLTALTSHLIPDTCHVRVRDALTVLEATLISSKQDKILLLLEKVLMEDLVMLSIERLLCYTPVQHILLLVLPKMKAKMIDSWKHAVSWSNGRKLAEQFSLTFMPQNDQSAQVCIATIVDIQRHVGVESTQPFFKAFDVMVIYDAPSNPGPAWIQIVDFFAAFDTCVIGLSSMLSEEDGKLLFGNVIDTKSTSNHKLNRA